MTANAETAADDATADLRREGDRIARLIDDLGAMAGAPVRQRVHELVRSLMHLYGTGLGNLLRLLGGDDGRIDDATRARLHADPLLSSLLVLHGLHPDPAAAHDFDPGAAPPPAGGLVRIDLARSRGAKPVGG